MDVDGTEYVGLPADHWRRWLTRTAPEDWDVQQVQGKAKLLLLSALGRVVAGPIKVGSAWATNRVFLERKHVGRAEGDSSLTETALLGSVTDHDWLSGLE
jgi:hypothetical protein